MCCCCKETRDALHYTYHAYAISELDFFAKRLTEARAMNNDAEARKMMDSLIVRFIVGQASSASLPVPDGVRDGRGQR